MVLNCQLQTIVSDDGQHGISVTGQKMKNPFQKITPERLELS
jgi:hypothetical protein